MPPIRNDSKSVSLSFEEREMIWLALTYRANMIETGNPILSAADVGNGADGKLQPLEVSQMRTLVMIDDLKRKINATN